MRTATWAIDREQLRFGGGHGSAFASIRRNATTCSIHRRRRAILFKWRRTREIKTRPSDEECGLVTTTLAAIMRAGLRFHSPRPSTLDPGMWHGIYGHDAIVERFRRTLEADRLASTYLFVGPSGIGKRRFALQLAHALLCTESADTLLKPCGHCESCRMFSTGNHPDLDVVGLRPDKSELAISQFVGFDDLLKQPALCQRIAFKPFYGGRRIAIVDDADHFNLSSANCLLKTLEEPPPRSLLILIGTSPSRQLPTIRSRAQLVRFHPLDTQTVERILLDTGLLADSAAARRAAELSEGSVERAMELADPDLWEFRQQLFVQLASTSAVRLSRAVQAFVDEAGKEAAKKRERLRTVLGFAISYFRKRLGEATSMPLAGPSGDGRIEPVDAIIGALDACLAATEHLDRNANLGILIQHWSESLAQPGSVQAVVTVT
jgi:DNA polymerase III subunit delta'